MNIIITGCSSGIGYQTVLELAKLGSHQIIGLARSTVGLNELKKDFLDLKSESTLKVISFDLDQEKYDYLLSNLPFNENQTLDILINNAGYLVNKPFSELNMDEWQKTFNVNLFASVKLIKALFPYFNRKQGAHIVNIGSMGGVQGTAKFKGLSAYSASKSAINVLTESLSVEFEQERISVNAINPGAVQTKMLEAAFPEYQADISAQQMGYFIAHFALNNKDVMNGRLVQASLKS